MILPEPIRSQLDEFKNIEHGIIHERSQGLIDYCCTFAAWAHRNQLRKYTGEPYVYHPIAVANIVAERTQDIGAICGALLHDTIEDTEVTRELIIQAGIGFDIADIVVELTDVATLADGNRATRKTIERDRLAKVSDRAQTVKLADLIHNTESIVEHDKKFAQIYMKEKEELLQVLTRGDIILQERAWDIVNKWKENS